MNELELDGLTRRHGPQTVIGPVSLEVRRGELLSLLGPSGCGKTTVLRMVAGFVVPHAGRVLLRGQDVTATPPHRRQVALVFQNFALFPHLSSFENIAFGLRRRGVAKADIARRVGALIASMQLDGLAERLPAQLSGGQQQRVAIARALAVEPAVVLLDEPFSSLDAKLRESTRYELRALQQQFGFTAILVTHDQSEALAISDRVAIMKDGLLEQVGSAQEIYHHPATRFVAGFVGRANPVPGGLLRPEAIRILADGTDPPPAGCEIARGVVQAAAFLGATSEFVVRTTDGRTLFVSADGLAPGRHGAGALVLLAWPRDAVIPLGDEA